MRKAIQGVAPFAAGYLGELTEGGQQDLKSRGSAFPQPPCHPVPERGEEAQSAGHGQGMEANLKEQECSCGAARQKAGDDEEVENGAAGFKRFARQSGSCTPGTTFEMVMPISSSAASSIQSM